MNNRVYVGISIIISLFLAYCLYMMFESYEEEQDLGWQKQALKKPYLAAELYLKRLGKNVHSYDGFEQLITNEQNPLASVDTLFISNTSQVLSDKRLNTIIDWVKGGGKLIVAAQRPSELSRDRLLQYLQITPYHTSYDKEWWSEHEDSSEIGEETEAERQEREQRKTQEKLEKINKKLAEKGLLKSKDKKKKETAEETIANFEKDVSKKEMTQLSFGEIQVDIHFDPSVALNHPVFFANDETTDSEDESSDNELKASSVVPQKTSPIYWQSDHYGVHFLQLYLGDGLVSVISDASIFNSNSIDKFDHGYLWELLANTQGDIAILYGVNIPSLWLMLKSYLPEALVMFSIWLSAWVWYSCRRFGPIQISNIRTRRSMSEHIFASASFLWGGGWQNEMLNPIREEIKRRAMQVIPDYSLGSASERLSKLADESGIDKDVITEAMATSIKLTEDSFVRTVQVLQKIRKSL